MATLVDYVGIQDAYAKFLAEEPPRGTVDHTIWEATHGDTVTHLHRLYLAACDFMGHCWEVGCDERRSRVNPKCGADHSNTDQ